MSKKLSLLLMLCLSAFLLPIPGSVSAGSPIGDRFLIYDTVGINEALPAIAYNSQGKEFLVVWQAENSATSTYEVWGRRVAISGLPLVTAFRISAVGEGRRPDVAYNSATNEYLVVWDEPGKVMAQRVSSGGSLVGAPIAVAESSLLAYDLPAVTYAETANRYLIVYRYRNIFGGGSAILARAYLPDGTPEAASFEVAAYSTTTDPTQPAVAYNRSRNEALVVWQQNYSADDLDLYAGQVLFAGGTTSLVSSFPLAQTIHDELLPAVAAIPTVPGEGQYLVTYQVDPDDINHDIHARVVSGTGTSVALVTLANTGWSELRPSVAGCGSNQQWLVTWVWEPVPGPNAILQVQARTLALDGTPLHPTVTATGGQVFDAAVAAGEACTHLIAFDDNATFGTFTRGIYGQIWGERIFLPLVIRGGITMSFVADRTTITLGECVTLSWLVEGAERVYLDGAQVPPSGTFYHCPIMNQEYELSAVDTLGNWVRKSITIVVLPGY